MTIAQRDKLGFSSIILLGINGIVGSGIFLLPGRIAALAGSKAMIVYGIASLLVMSIAWCFAQCAAFYTRNGGAYLYAKEAFGDFAGFQIGMMRWAVGMIGWASLAVGFVTALGAVWPWAAEEPVRTLLIVGLITSLGTLNFFGIRIFKLFNNVISISKLIPLIGFIIIGMIYLTTTPNTHSIQEFNLENTSLGAATLVLFYAFGGFESLVSVAGEMQNPKKHLPIVVILVLAICSLIYLSIHMISVGVLGQDLQFSNTPIADAAEIFFGSHGKWFVMIATIISITGINFSASFITPRSGVVLAEDGMIPPIFAKLSRFDSPYLAIILTVGITSLVAMAGDFTQLAAISVVSRLVQYTSTCSAVIFLTRKHEVSQSIFRKVTTIAIPLAALSGVFWLLLQAEIYQICIGLGALVLNTPLYFMRKRRPELYETL